MVNMLKGTVFILFILFYFVCVLLLPLTQSFANHILSLFYFKFWLTSFLLILYVTGSAFLNMCHTPLLTFT